MRNSWGLGRWLVFGMVVFIAAVLGVFLALRPMITMRPPRVISRRADDTLYQATPPDAADDLPDYLEGTESATPPEGYPVKGNRRSGIYHLPGDLAYERTVPSLWFRSAEAAERNGFRHALR